MAFQPTAPITKEVPLRGVKPEPLNEFHVHELTFVLEPRQPLVTKARVVWTKGYDDTEAGEYVPEEMYVEHLEGTELVAALIGLVTVGNTRYDEVQSAIWQLLIDEGIVPAGSVV